MWVTNRGVVYPDAERMTGAVGVNLHQRLTRLDRRYLVGLGVFTAVYFATARLGLLMDAVSGFATTVWPPTGISLVVLSLFGYRLWPGIAFGAFLVNLSVGAPVLVAGGMAAGNTLEAVFGTYLLRRFAGFRGFPDSIKGVASFVVLVAGLSTTVSAAIGVASGWLGSVIPSATTGRAWLTWWLGDAMGDLILAPLLFVWSERPRFAFSPWRLAEGGGLLASLVMVGLLVFSDPFPSPQTLFLKPYLLFPFLVWAALRFRQHGTVTATFVVASVAIWRTASGAGPFATATLNESLLLLQAFMAIVSVTMLAFAAGINERRRTLTRMKVGYSVGRILADASSLGGAIPRILEAVCEPLEWDCGNVWIVDTGNDTLRHAAEWHRSVGLLKEPMSAGKRVNFGPGVGMAGRVWREGRPIWVPNPATDTNFVRADHARELHLRSAMGFPICVAGEVHGVMTFFSRTIREPDDTLLQTMRTLGSHIGESIQRLRAEEDLRRAHAELEARIAHRTSQLSEMNQTLHREIAERKEAEQSLRQLSARLLRIQDEERHRLARELHDSTAQSLAALSMNLAVARGRGEAHDQRMKIALDEAAALAEGCSREIRSLSHLLHPPLLEEVGLSAAVRWCAEGFARRSGIAVEVDLPEHFGRLPTEVENALFRIVQECLTNVQRHSGSPSARIQLSRNSHSVSLEVRDQGRGMPPDLLDRHDAIASLGVGLLGMRERVRQLGGHLRIESSGTGSNIQVEIDLGSQGS
jgi:signal transduction histidine kinase